MSKNEESIKYISPYFKDNNSYSLLIPYYTSDKWTNKLKNKVKSLAEAYKAFYQRLEQENTFNNDNEESNSYNNYNNGKHIKNNKYLNKTLTNMKNDDTISNINNNDRNILNKILPPVTNYKYYENDSKDNTYNYTNLNNLNDPYLFPKKNKIFCISAQQRNQKANMNKYYSNQKLKDIFYFKNNKKINSTKELFSSKAHDDDYNKFISEFQNKKRINFFKKNDYNPRIKSTQPKNRKQIWEMKDIKKKQYLDYIKVKSEDNYMKYYYYQ